MNENKLYFILLFMKYLILISYFQLWGWGWGWGWGWEIGRAHV